MAVARAGFPPDLLSQPWSARIHYFQAYMMAHPRLVATREALLNAIHEVPANSLILVFGPTGVGKTTLREKIEQVLAAELLPMLLRLQERLLNHIRGVQNALGECFQSQPGQSATGWLSIPSACYAMHLRVAAAWSTATRMRGSFDDHGSG